MIASKRKDKILPKLQEPEEEVNSSLRRSSRVVKVKYDDDFLMGHDQLDQYIGKDQSQDGQGKRPRKSYCYDDFSDFSDNHRGSKKKYRRSQSMRRFQTMNAVEGLLKWREEIRIVDIPAPTPENSQLIKVKNICKQALDKHAQGIEALFINIDWDKKNQTIEDFKNLKIQSLKFMPKGLIFIWTPKEHIAQIIEIMDEKGFNYVENLQIGILDRLKAYEIYRAKRNIPTKPKKESNLGAKKKQIKNTERQDTQDIDNDDFPFDDVVSCLDNIDPNQLIHRESYEYFNKSKKTLYIFRRNSDEKIELRHQRTCDVVFDMPRNPTGKCEKQLKNYLFLMIQTMLPKCLEFNKDLKMVELWGDNEMRRRGWINMVQI